MSNGNSEHVAIYSTYDTIIEMNNLHKQADLQSWDVAHTNELTLNFHPQISRFSWEVMKRKEENGIPDHANVAINSQQCVDIVKDGSNIHRTS